MNPILATDSYKLTHWRQYPPNTETVYSYLESRPGAQWDYTVFFGLQVILDKLQGDIVTQQAIDDAGRLADVHFGRPGMFNREGWEHILAEHEGRLPLRIKAVPEGTVVPTGNVLMSVENTDPACFWLTNVVESLLTHVWYPSTVATLSRTTKEMLASHLTATGATLDGLPFMLHDFGYRGASSDETAAIGGAAHLVNFMGTDTVPAMLLAMEHYAADLDTLAFSVPATEHSVMTARGEAAEDLVVEQCLNVYPKGILSVVADSYDVYRFLDRTASIHHHEIMARDGVFVFRPDSVAVGETPAMVMERLSMMLWERFGGEINDRGYKVLDPHVRLLWGDGIDPEGIDTILHECAAGGFSAENYVFGMGGGLLQKVNRDTQRFAFKSSAQKRNGVWRDVWKKPLDVSKASKRGRLKLIETEAGLITVPESAPGDDLLRVVYADGQYTPRDKFSEVRERAELPAKIVA